jgi:hypothetical protein
MPRKSNSGPSKTSVTAARRSKDALGEALPRIAAKDPEAPKFYSVQKVLGNGAFLIHDTAGHGYRGLGGHGGGKARIAVGHIVLADYSQWPQQGVVITALIDERKVANELVKNGYIEQALMNAAVSAGSVSSTGRQLDEDAYTFQEEEQEGEQEDGAGGGGGRIRKGGDVDVDVDAL